jgi:hypothetical protein
MDVENEEFLRFVQVAGENRLEYLLIGGLALAMHGIVRYTQDADVWIAPTDENKEHFLDTLIGLGYDSEELDNIRQLDFKEPQILKLEGPIDILTRVHFRMEYDVCRSRAREFESAVGYKIYFIHINDLREFKILARRPKDLYDVVMIDQLLEKMSGKSDGN